MNFNRIKWIGDLVILLALAIYVAIGRDDAPFHGDESSHIYISRDYFYLVHDHNLSRIAYDPTLTNSQEQWERLMTGSVHRMAIGLALDLAGLKVSDLNQDWNWDHPVSWNVAGNMPGARALEAGRTSSVVLTILSIVAVWGIALRVTPNRIMVWTATLVYGTTPMVLLDGRRAMMEGALLLSLALVGLAALIVIRQQARDNWSRVGWAYALLGITAGLALASKPNSAFTVGVMFLVVALAPAWDGLHINPQMHPAWRLPRFRRMLIGAWALAVATFLLLTPAWWPNVMGVLIRVTTDRVNLIQKQEGEHGAYGGWGDRAEGLVKQAFYGGPSYYESPLWKNEPLVQRQIKEYEADHLAGRMGGPVWGILLGAAFVVGNAVLLRSARRNAVARLALLWFWVNALGLFLTNPLPWARYYLVFQIPLALCVGIGVWWTTSRMAEPFRMETGRSKP